MESEKIFEVLTAMSRKMEEEKLYLTDLDNATGDGDHGINMAKGFSAMAEKLPTLAGQSLGAVFKTVGMTLVSAVGGSAGPLYGTAFLKSALVMGEKTGMDMDDFLTCLGAAIEGIMMRGHAVRGEKTMLDAMIPALDAMKAAKADGLAPRDILDAGVTAAHEGIEFTKTIAATKGRASYIGERSIGHEDPGAVSFTYLLEVVACAV